MSRTPISPARSSVVRRAALLLVAGLFTTALLASGHVAPAAATGTASISGTVRAAGTGVGIQGVGVLAILPNGAPGGDASTDANGNYTIRGLAAGSYTLDFEPGSAYAEQWWSGKNSQQTADFFTVATGQVLTGKNAALLAPGSISGTVMGSGSPDVPLGGEQVLLFGSTGVLYSAVFTDGGGGYSFNGLAPGSYKVQFSASGNYTGQWWFGASTKATATPISVSSGQDVAGISPVLSSGSTISGTVTAPGFTSGLSGATVTATSSLGAVKQALTDSAGRYILEDLSAGTYTVEFLPAPGQSFAAQWWNNASSPAAATHIVVAADQAVSGINATLVAQSSVSGTVFQGDPSTPVAGVNVNAIRSDGTYAGSNGVTDSSGHFTIGQLPPGSYTLLYTPNETPGAEQNFALQWWNDKPSQAAADYFTVTAGQAVTGKDAVMVSGATITGTVQAGSPAADLQGVDVTVYSVDGQIRGGVLTDANGHYSIDKLAAGTYAVKFAGPSPYDTEWSGGGLSLHAAAPLTVTAGQTATEDATLAVGASLAGTLTYGGGAPATGYVGVYDAAGASDSLGSLVRETAVGADGSYTITGLAPGHYKVGFTHDTTGLIARGPLPSSSPYASEWYQHATSFATASAVSVAAGQSLRGIDGKLEVAAGSSVRLHDYSGDGHPDVLARTVAGALMSYHANGVGGWSAPVSSQVGSGWNGMTAIVAPGDFNGDGKPDVIARDTTGALWLYPGNGSGGWGARVHIGSGWNGMTAIIGVGDFNGDGKADLVSRDVSGRLWVYPGNGKGGFGPNSVIGSGWNGMTAIVGAGDFNGDGFPDILARDGAGLLWLYPHTPTGWKARTQVGSGWNGMTAIISVGDFNGDSHTDVIARDSTGLLWLYPGNGRSGWLTRVRIGSGWNGMSWIG